MVASFVPENVNAKNALMENAVAATFVVKGNVLGSRRTRTIDVDVLTFQMFFTKNGKFIPPRNQNRESEL